MSNVPSRTDLMVDRYGEVCTKSEAARILGRSMNWIYKALEDGRIQDACGGSMVDVRSIAAYIEQPRQRDSEARARRIRTKYHSEFAV